MPSCEIYLSLSSLRGSAEEPATAAILISFNCILSKDVPSKPQHQRLKLRAQIQKLLNADG